MTTPNTNWRERYVTGIDSLYRRWDDLTFTPDVEAVAITLGIIEEIRLGLAAGLLDGPAPEAVPITTDPDCPHCPHDRRQHSARGCTWENRPGDNICSCTLTYMELAARPVIKRDVEHEFSEDPMPEQADPVYVPKLSVPMRDEQPRSTQLAGPGHDPTCTRCQHFLTSHDGTVGCCVASCPCDAFEPILDPRDFPPHY